MWLFAAIYIYLLNVYILENETFSFFLGRLYKPVDDVFRLFNDAALWISRVSPRDVTSCTFPSASS